MALTFNVDLIRFELPDEYVGKCHVLRASRLPPSAASLRDGGQAAVPESAPRAPSGRGVVARATDDLGSQDIASLLGMAIKLGYVEQQAPNEGVRKMRILNFLRARNKG